jgi:hypothetical protein
LKFFGRFAPTGPVSGIFTGGASVLAPQIGIPMALGSAASRVAATNMRRSTVEDLANIMRMGRTPDVIGGPFRALPATTIRGLLSLQDLEEQQKNLMGIQ